MSVTIQIAGMHLLESMTKQHTVKARNTFKKHATV